MKFFKRNPDGTFAPKKLLRKLYFLTGFAVAVLAVGHFYVEPWIDESIETAKKIKTSLSSEIVAYADTTAPSPEVKVIKIDSILLDRIADCESGKRKADGTAVGNSARQFDVNGNVIRNKNTNGSIDIGKYQINFDVWGYIAMEKGFNLFTEEGNAAMAEYIFLNRGTGDWYASQSCWKRN